MPRITIVDKIYEAAADTRVYNQTGARLSVTKITIHSSKYSSSTGVGDVGSMLSIVSFGCLVTGSTPDLQFEYNKFIVGSGPVIDLLNIDLSSAPASPFAGARSCFCSSSVCYHL